MNRSGVSFGSVCSGIEAASVAWHPLGWRAAWLAEVAAFPCAVLAHHYPSVPNLGDMTAIADRVLSGGVSAPDVFCGGTPCQAFSVAGLRESLADARGNLTLTFVEIANAIDHVRTGSGKQECIVFWENVPGVLSTKDNAFGCFLGGLAGEDGPLEPPGGKWANAGAVYGPRRTVAWRTLDAQYFGVAQRRRRVFVVASARKGFDPAQVLFEWDGVRRDTAPSREARQTAPSIPSRSTAGGGLGTDFDCDGGLIAGTLQAGGKAAGSATQQDAESGLLLPVAFGGNRTSGRIDITQALLAQPGSGWKGDFESETFLVQPAHTLLGKPNCSHAADKETYVTHSLRGEGFDASEEGTGRGTPLVPVAFDTTQITSAANYSSPKSGDPCHPLAAGAHAPAIAFPANLSGTQCASAKNIAPAMGAANPTAVATAGMQVRRLTTEDCEALQGFQRGYTRIPNWSGWREMDQGETPEGLRAQGMKVKQSKKTGNWRVNDPDGPRYKALGNSWAVPNVAWIGRRIAAAIGKNESGAND